jgi:putative DNA primase/helicase
MPESLANLDREFEKARARLISQDDRKHKRSQKQRLKQGTNGTAQHGGTPAGHVNGQEPSGDKATADSSDGLTMNPEKGLTATVRKGSGRNVRIETVWVSAPFEIVGRVRDPKSEGWARLLRWRDDDGRLHEHSVSDADLHSDASLLCSNLASQGLRIATGPTRGHLIRYLNKTTVENRVTIFPRTGWHNVGGKNTFVLPGGVADGDRTVIVAGAAISPYEAAATLKDWQGSVGKLVAVHVRPIFCVSDAFAAPLVKISDADSGGFNMKGLSSIGKTTLLRAAASVWGRGDEHGMLRTWRATGNGLEGTAAFFSDTLLPLDELGVASPQEVGNIVYSLASGIGKQRAQRDGSPRPPNTWSVMILSTGELGIADKIREAGARVRAGQEIRIIDIDADAGKGFGVFDNGGPDEDAAKLAAAIKTAATTYYGTAGPAFVKAIVAEGVNKIASMVRDAQDALAQQIAAGAQNGQVLRAARQFALVGAAGELAIQLGVLPWTPGVVAAAAKELFSRWRGNRGEDPAEIREAIEQIGTLLDRYGDSRFDPPTRSPDTRPVLDRLGWVRGEGDNRQWLIPPGLWRTVFCNGFDPKTIARVFAERGMLLPDPEGKFSRSERVDGEPTRVYVLTAMVRAVSKGVVP